MSFKREVDSDSSSHFQQLQAQQVCELLEDHIPEDEVFMLRDGRYACLVCSYRPVCDTLTVLSRHRAGKKHLYCLAQFLDKKRQMEVLTEKYQQKIHLQTNLKLQQTSERVLGEGVANRRDTSKKTPYMRKEVINLKCLDSTNSTQKLEPTQSSTTQKNVKKYIKQTLHKNNVRESEEDWRRSQHTIHNNKTTIKPAYQASSKCISKSIDNGRNQCGTQNNVSNLESKNSAVHQQALNLNIELQTTPLSPDPESIKCKLDQNTSQQNSKGTNQNLNADRCEYYQKLRAAGWKRDLLGNWVRDEEAEFDSDEEPPKEYEDIKNS